MPQSGLPVLAIWGREDEVIPISGMGKLAEWNRRAEHEVIEGAGHALAYSHSDEVVGLLLPALRRHKRNRTPFWGPAQCLRFDKHLR